MQEVKDTVRAMVRIGYDGRVHKTFRGTNARERFENEVRVLKYLEEKGCDFVPKVLEADPELLKLVTTNCGARVEHMSEEKMKEVFGKLEQYGVRHEDAFLRNITYNAREGRFCVIDFEFATLLDEEPPTSEATLPAPAA
jgi:tRNA A-37 threonylcarbamoyl transferase component Bud32